MSNLLLLLGPVASIAGAIVSVVVLVKLNSVAKDMGVALQRLNDLRKNK